MPALLKRFEAKDLHAEIEKYKQRLASHLQVSAKTVPLHLTLGKLYEHAGKKTEAIQEYAKVALFYVDQGNTMKAMATTQMMAQLAPENDELVERLKDLFSMRQAASADQMESYQDAIKQIEALQGETSEGTAVGKEEADQGAAAAQAAEEVVQALKQISLFSKLSVSELRGIQSYSALHQLAVGDPVFTGGNVRRSLFAILEGQVKIFGRDQNQQNILLVTLGAGSSFGEFGLFGRIDTSVSVIAATACRVLEIPREVIMKIAKTRPVVIEALKDLFKRRILENALSRVPLFTHLKPEDRRKLMKYFKGVRANQGATLMREGTAGDSMYFIISGEVGVYTSLSDPEEGSSGENEQLLLATLKSGDFFGEQALVNNEPRSATVIALSEVTLLKFSRPDLETVIQEHPWIESELQIEAFENKMRKNMAVLNQLVTT